MVLVKFIKPCKGSGREIGDIVDLSQSLFDYYSSVDAVESLETNKDAEVLTITEIENIENKDLTARRRKIIKETI